MRDHRRPGRLEASGGLTLDRAREVAETGVDFFAVGALTHSAPVLDIALDLAAPEPVLCADIGNSHTVLGLLRGRQGASTTGGCTTDERRTADEWGC